MPYGPSTFVKLLTLDFNTHSKLLLHVGRVLERVHYLHAGLQNMYYIQTKSYLQVLLHVMRVYSKVHN